MPPTFRIVPAENVPPDARVRDYDELPEPAKARLPRLAASSGATTTDATFESPAETCDLVKFTDYYRIERA